MYVEIQECLTFAQFVSTCSVSSSGVENTEFAKRAEIYDLKQPIASKRNSGQRSATNLNHIVLINSTC